MERGRSGTEIVNNLTHSSAIVRITSNDEIPQAFFINKDVACQAKHLDAYFKTCEEEGRPLDITLDMPAHTLETVVKYLHYRIINKDLEVDQRSKFDLKPEEALDVLNASKYLQC